MLKTIILIGGPQKGKHRETTSRPKVGEIWRTGVQIGILFGINNDPESLLTSCIMQFLSRGKGDVYLHL